MTIAVCNANFHGDVLWSVPAAREVAHRAGAKADFYIGLRGAATADLLAAQGFVRDVIVCDTWNSDDLRPPSDIAYSAVHHLHMRGETAQNGTLLDHFCHVAGLPRQGHWFDLPQRSVDVPKGPFVVLAAKVGDRSEWMKAINAIFRGFVKLCPVPIVEVGCKDMALATDLGTIDRCTPGFLEMAQIISRAKVFVGTMSAPLVVADACEGLPRIAVHDGEKWNMNAVTKSHLNHYYVYPTPHQLADIVKGLL